MLGTCAGSDSRMGTMGVIRLVAESVCRCSDDGAWVMCVQCVTRWCGDCDDLQVWYGDSSSLLCIGCAGDVS